MILHYRFILTIMFCFCYMTNNMAQLQYPITGQYKKSSAQGMAIWGDNAYLMSDGGRCRVYNLKSARVTNEFMLASAAKDNHVNNACFGKAYGTENGTPLLYITECKNLFRCFVERIESGSSRLVQEIQAQEKGKVQKVLVWVIDAENNFLYGITRNGKKLDSIGTVTNTITKYRLPKTEEGKEIVLNEKDVLDRFDVLFPNILQGAKIKGRYLYMVTGLQEPLFERQDAGRAVKMVDLKKKKLVKNIDLTYVTTNEPEDMDFYKRKALLYCGQNGGLYGLNL